MAGFAAPGFCSLFPAGLPNRRLVDGDLAQPEKAGHPGGLVGRDVSRTFSQADDVVADLGRQP